MANFCKNCGRPLHGGRYCMNCGTLNEDGEPTPPEKGTVSDGTHADAETNGFAAKTAQDDRYTQTTSPSSAPQKSGNGLLIATLVVLCVVMGCIVVGIVNSGRRQPSTEADSGTPAVSEPYVSQDENLSGNNKDSLATSSPHQGYSTWDDVRGFDYGSFQYAVEVLFHGGYLDSYGSLDYDANTGILMVYDCQLAFPPESLLNFYDTRIDFQVDLSGGLANYTIGDFAYYGCPLLHVGAAVSVEDDDGHTIEVYYEHNATIAENNRAIIFPQVCIVDRYRNSLGDSNDSTLYLDMCLRPRYNSTDGYYSYVLYSEDGYYEIYLDEDFIPVSYLASYTTQY